MAAADSSTDQQRQWIIKMKEVLETEDLETTILSPPCIFHLPDSILNHNQKNVYIPQRISLGPHHHNKLHYNMEIFKLNLAKKARQNLHLPDFHQLIQNNLLPLQLRIRSCFDVDLALGGDTLSWILLVDALFLLQLLLSKPTSRVTENSNLFRSEQDKFVAHFEIVSDVLKLENQIPCLVVKAILSTNVDNAVDLPRLLYDFSESVSPFTLTDHRPHISGILDQSSHLLHYIYFSILILPIYYSKHHPSATRSNKSAYAVFLQKSLGILASVLNIPFILQLSQAIGLIVEITQPVSSMFKNQSSSAPEETPSPSFPPVIPSASQLKKVNVKFSDTDHGILDTRFYKSSATLILPVITVNDFTETLFANLVAFEAMANIYPPVFSQYLKLMQALIPTPKDLKILKNANIIRTKLGSDDDDEHVLKLFHRVGSSIICCSAKKKPSFEQLKHLHNSSKGSTSESEAKMGKIEEEIKSKYERGLKGIVEEINNYYGSCARVKVKRFLGNYGIVVLKILALLVILFLVFLVLLPLVSSAKKLFKTHV